MKSTADTTTGGTGRRDPRPPRLTEKILLILIFIGVLYLIIVIKAKPTYKYYELHPYNSSDTTATGGSRTHDGKEPKLKADTLILYYSLTTTDTTRKGRDKEPQ